MKKVSTQQWIFDDLSAENRKQAIRIIDTSMTENGIDYEIRAQHRLMMERILQKYAEFNKSAPFRIIAHRSYSTFSVSLRMKSESFDLMKDQDWLIDEELLSHLKNPPKYSYFMGENRVYYTIKVPAPGKEALSYVFHYMDKEKFAFRTGVALRFVNMFLLVVEPLLAAAIITALSGGELKKILMLAIMMALLDAAGSLVTYIASRNLTKAYTSMREEMQTDLAKTVQDIKIENIDSHSSGLFIQRIMDETNNVVDGLDQMLNVVTEAFRLIALLVAFALVSKTMLAFELVLFIIYFLIVKAQAKKLNDDNRTLRVSKEKLNGITTEMVKANHDIKLLNCKDSFINKAKEFISDYTQKTQDVQNHSNTYIFARRQFVAWTNLLYLAVLVYLMWKHGMTPATALVLYNYNGKTYLSAQAVSTAAEHIYGLTLAAERVYQLLYSKDFAQEEWGEEKLETTKGDIQIQDVHFSYKNEKDVLLPILKGVNLQIKPGESVAFVGKSGCGKSTILSLITKLYDPEQGHIQIDGIDISKLDEPSIRSNIGMVTQQPYIFNMTIRENFAIIKENLTDEEMIKACKIACIHDDIMKLPLGYDTMAGEGGIMLSGGQRQRIALARCIIQDYPIIVLDEATSALDNETQEKIRIAIENMEGKIVIMVAHRLSTVINCDKLFYIEDGKVLAQGTHKELLENCEEYRRLEGADSKNIA